MKSVLISIQPQWVEKIAAGWKTLELRKTVPNLPTPFKCYIYQTRLKWVFNLLRRLGMDGIADALSNGFGKVVGEFVCDGYLRNCEMANADIAERQSYVRREKILEYSGGKQVYGWHISDLVIYDKPKSLSAFRSPCKEYEKDRPICGACRYYYYESNESVGFYEECLCDGLKHIARPPQSWCYVED